MHPAAKRQWIRQLKSDPARLSFYRMIRSPEFEELCTFYENGIGIRSFDEFARIASRLERVFYSL